MQHTVPEVGFPLKRTLQGQGVAPQSTQPPHGPLLTVAALWVGKGESSEARLAKVTALSLHMLFAYTLARQWVTGSSWDCPIWITLAG